MQLYHKNPLKPGIKFFSRTIHPLLPWLKLIAPQATTPIPRTIATIQAGILSCSHTNKWTDHVASSYLSSPDYPPGRLIGLSPKRFPSALGRIYSSIITQYTFIRMLRSTTHFLSTDFCFLIYWFLFQSYFGIPTGLGK
jgi:hypothetical protein